MVEREGRWQSFKDIDRSAYAKTLPLFCPATLGVKRRVGHGTGFSNDVSVASVKAARADALRAAVDANDEFLRYRRCRSDWSQTA